jgi:hypothetical protein
MSRNLYRTRQFIFVRTKVLHLHPVKCYVIHAYKAYITSNTSEISQIQILKLNLSGFNCLNVHVRTIEKKRKIIRRISKREEEADEYLAC